MWKTSIYSKREINDAGKIIIKDAITEQEKTNALEVIDSWRSAHAFPMNTFAINLKHKVSNIKGAVVVQRLKRLDTIVGKLKRYPKMELYRMQDLGGCRVIVPTIEDVYSVVKQLRSSRIRHEESNYKDYIAIPKPETGYRGYHLIYKYRSDKKADYNGMLIEIQIRTRLQHLWATAVETVGLFTGNGLKFNQGSEEWIHFFKLVSALFSIEEQSAIVEGTPTNSVELITEIVSLIEKLDVIHKLYTIGTATEVLGHVSKRMQNGYYLIINTFPQDSTPGSIRVEVFPGAEKGLEAATEAYNSFESKKKSNEDAVLVFAPSYETIVYAYPNYFSDISAFTKKVNEINTAVIQGAAKL